MATITVQTIVRAGVDPTPVAAAGGGDGFANDGRTFFWLSNGSGVSVTATFATPQTVAGLAIADLAVAVPAGEDRMIGPFPKALFNDGTGLVQVTYSAVTTVTVAALRM